LVGKVKEFVEEQLETIAQTKGYKILEARVMPDHIHLFIEADPFDSPTNIVKIFKGVTGLRIPRKFPYIESKLWRGVMWSPSSMLELLVMYLPRRLKGISENSRQSGSVVHLPVKTGSLPT
jgi:REP element-mobilizing transposase RayT